MNGYTGDNCETGNLRCYCDIVKGRKRDNNLFYLVKLKIHVILIHVKMVVHAQITEMRQVHIIVALAQMDIRDPIVKYVKKIEFRILPFNKKSNQIKLFELKAPCDFVSCQNNAPCVNFGNNTDPYCFCNCIHGYTDTNCGTRN